MTVHKPCMEHTQLTKVKETFSTVHETVEHVNDDGASSTKNWCDLGPYFRTACKKRTRNINFNNCMTWMISLLSWCQQLKQHSHLLMKEEVCQESITTLFWTSAEDILASVKHGRWRVICHTEGRMTQWNSKGWNWGHTCRNPGTDEEVGKASHYQQSWEQPEEKHGFFARLFQERGRNERKEKLFSSAFWRRQLGLRKTMKVMREEQKRQSEALSTTRETRRSGWKYHWINTDVSSHWKKIWPISCDGVVDTTRKVQVSCHATIGWYIWRLQTISWWKN